MPESAAGTKSILVVDDDPAVHRLLVDVLAAPDRHIDTSLDAIDALARMADAYYDLVITDIKMPGIDGIELLHRIREKSPRTRVIVITGAGTPEQVVRSLRDNAFAYFSKPFSPAAIAGMIAQALSAPDWQNDIRIISATPDWISLIVRCRTGNAERLIQFFREMEVRLTPTERDHIAMAFHELLMNAIEHGCGSNPDQCLRLGFIRTSRAIIYHIEDPGQGFSLASLPHAALSNPPEQPFRHTIAREERGMRPGGFGILLARNLVDELLYNEKGNEVLLIKYLN